MNKIALNILAFFVFFPYLKIIPIDGTGDTQPLALILSIIMLFFIFLKKKSIKLRFEYLLLLGIFLFSLFVVGFCGFSLVSLKSIVGYLSLFTISTVFSYYFKNKIYISDYFLKFVILAWGFVGLVQTYIYPSFLSFILPRAITDGGLRGVVGLAPEPSYYGTMCFFLLFFSVFQLRSKFFSFFLLFQIIVLAKSSLLLLVLLFVAFLYLLFYRKFLIIIGVSLSFTVVVIPLFAFFTEGSRMYNLSNAFIKDPLLIFETDQSLNDRLSAIYFSIKGFLDHYGFPSGIGTYESYVTKEYPHQDFFWGLISSKIMSGYGCLLFELGFIGLIIPILFYKAISHYFGVEKQMKWVIFFSFSLFMFTPVPIALPILGFFYSYLLYHKSPNNA